MKVSVRLTSKLIKHTSPDYTSNATVWLEYVEFDGEGKNEPDHCNMSVLQLALQFLRRTNGIIINVCSSEFLLLTWTGRLHCGWKGGTAA